MEPSFFRSDAHGGSPVSLAAGPSVSGKNRFRVQSGYVVKRFRGIRKNIGFLASLGEVLDAVLASSHLTVARRCGQLDS